MERRILINYRLGPELAARLLPSPLRPRTIAGFAVAGISLVRLGLFGRGSVPGVRVETAAHRIAVEWDSDGSSEVSSGMWVLRRDTDAWAAALGAGRLFPGRPRYARFDVEEAPDRLRVGYVGRQIQVGVDLDIVPGLSGSRLFADLDDASRFLAAGSVTGPDLRRARADLRRWAVEAAAIRDVHSSWFEDAQRFAGDSMTVDSALVLRRMPIRWVGAPSFARVRIAGSRMPLPAA